MILKLEANKAKLRVKKVLHPVVHAQRPRWNLVDFKTNRVVPPSEAENLLCQRKHLKHEPALHFSEHGATDDADSAAIQRASIFSEEW